MPQSLSKPRSWWQATEAARAWRLDLLADPNALRRHYLTMQYNSTFIRTFNIAHGAATIDRSVVAPHQFLNYTHTFKEQVDQIFLNNYTAAGKTPMATWDPEKSLFTVWFGVVDISLLVDRAEYLGENVQKMVKAYEAILDTVWLTH